MKINQKCESALADRQPDKIGKDLVNFHRVIAQCTANPVLIFILTFIEDLLQDTKDLLRPDHNFFATVVQAHKRICKALMNRDAEAAYEEMYKDVSNVEQYLVSMKNDLPFTYITLLSSFCLFHIDHKGLCFGDHSIGITNCWREKICTVSAAPVCWVFPSKVPWQSYLVYRVAHDLEWFHPVCNDCNCPDLATW